jgi:hypothetical protein
MQFLFAPVLYFSFLKKLCLTTATQTKQKIHGQKLFSRSILKIERAVV